VVVVEVVAEVEDEAVVEEVEAVATVVVEEEVTEDPEPTATVVAEEVEATVVRGGKVPLAFRWVVHRLELPAHTDSPFWP